MRPSSENKIPSLPESPIVIFDGVCNLCNASVDFILRRDPQHVFRFTANQHETGSRILSAFGKDSGSVRTVYLLEDGKLHERSTAALRIVRRMKFPWFLLYGLIIFPAFLRDAVYDRIARNRYRWFGKRDTCRMPTEAERSLFLD